MKCLEEEGDGTTEKLKAESYDQFFILCNVIAAAAVGYYNLNNNIIYFEKFIPWVAFFFILIEYIYILRNKLDEQPKSPSVLLFKQSIFSLKLWVFVVSSCLAFLAVSACVSSGIPHYFPNYFNSKPDLVELTPFGSNCPLNGIEGEPILWFANAKDAEDAGSLLYKFGKKGPKDNEFRDYTNYSTNQNWMWIPKQDDVGSNNISVKVIDGHHASTTKYDDIFYCNLIINPKQKEPQQQSSVSPQAYWGLQIFNPYLNHRNEMENLKKYVDIKVAERKPRSGGSSCPVSVFYQTETATTVAPSEIAAEDTEDKTEAATTVAPSEIAAEDAEDKTEAATTVAPSEIAAEDTEDKTEAATTVAPSEIAAEDAEDKKTEAATTVDQYARTSSKTISQTPGTNIGGIIGKLFS